MITILTLFYFAICLIIATFLVSVLKMLIFRRGKAYLYIRDINGNVLSEIYLAVVKSVSGSGNYKIYDTSKGGSNHYVGEVQVTNNKGIVRLTQTTNNPDNYILTDAGEVDENGDIYLYENGQTKKIGNCNPNGNRKLRDLWILRHTEVETEGGNGEFIGRCTESLRFRKKKAGEITIIARAAAVLLLYKSKVSFEEESRHPARIPIGHLALPSALIYFLGFVILNKLFDLHDLFPLVGHIISYVAAMLLMYLAIIWILKLITTDMLMRGKPFGSWLTLCNRNTGLKGWNILLITLLVAAIVISISIRGFEFLPLWIVLLAGVSLNMASYYSPQWQIKHPADGYLNIQYALAGANAVSFDPYANAQQTDLEKKLYSWSFDSVLKGKKIEVSKELTFDKKYISDKRAKNPFAKDNAEATKNLYKSSREVIKGSPDQIGDWLIEQLLNKISEVARTEQLSRYDTMQLILSFCQHPNFDWVMDYDCPEIGNAADYFRFPIETIYDKRGDCDCTALMGFMIFKKAGIPSAYILMIGEGGSKHAAFAIGNVPENEVGANDGIITIAGKKYYFCETVGEDWKVGVLPDSYAQNLRLFEQKLSTNPEMVIVSEDF